MPNMIVLLRVIRNISIAIISAGWFWAFSVSFIALLSFLKMCETELAKPDWPNGFPFSYVELAKWLLEIAMCWGTVVIFLWSLIAANKLWPVKPGVIDKKKQGKCCSSEH